MKWKKCGRFGGLAMAFLLAHGVFADDIYVDDTNPNTGNGTSNNPYKSIHDGIDDAEEGDIVKVARNLQLTAACPADSRRVPMR